ncbi:MmcQ/YjbR family DNA-binding protein [Acidothermaceae bacterium B102]|nr:MmcQ/YjbR family DNA-binding protein [Acidothermaceae bacterium B102]
MVPLEGPPEPAYAEAMVDWDDVAAAAGVLPAVTQDGHTWSVRGKSFLWERPLGKADTRAMGDAMRDAPILGARTADEGVKLALIADDPAVFFTIPHFDGFPAVLVWLDRLDRPTLQELVTDAWLSRAPQRLVDAFLTS